MHRDFPGGTVFKNPPSNAGDAGSIPGRGTKIPHASEQLSLQATATEPTLHKERSHVWQLRPNAAKKRKRNAQRTASWWQEKEGNTQRSSREGPNALNGRAQWSPTPSARAPGSLRTQQDLCGSHEAPFFIPACALSLVHPPQENTRGSER